MRYRPEAVTAAILEVADAGLISGGGTVACRSSTRRSTSPTTSPIETYMGVAVPANEVAERAERIRAALEADGGFALTGPTEHGEAPITAVHDPGLVRFLEVAWSEVRRQGSRAPSCRPTRTRTARCSRG